MKIALQSRDVGSSDVLGESIAITRDTIVEINDEYNLKNPKLIVRFIDEPVPLQDSVSLTNPSPAGNVLFVSFKAYIDPSRYISRTIC